MTKPDIMPLGTILLIIITIFIWAHVLGFFKAGPNNVLMIEPIAIFETGHQRHGAVYAYNNCQYIINYDGGILEIGNDSPNRKSSPGGVGTQVRSRSVHDLRTAKFKENK